MIPSFIHEIHLFLSDKVEKLLYFSGVATEL